MFDTLSPVHLFWPLLAVCLAGLALLYAAVRDAGRGARRRGLLRRVDALGAPADHAAVDALKEAMAQARTSLRQAPRTRATAPWFLFIGGPATGLPGLLSAARAECVAPPPHEAPGTPWWRWWTTGALTAIELHPDAIGDQAGTAPARGLWLQSLLALAERRERLPLHGVVVCVAAGDLLYGDPALRKRATANMRRLLDEASDTLRLQLPVYLVVTGLEGLKGYATLRAALPPEVLAQALGHRVEHPFAAHAARAADRLDALFDPLVAQLHGLRMALLREQPGPAGRLALHGFVERVRTLQPALRQVAQGLFEGHGKGVRAPRWRGLYLTATASENGTGAAFVSDLFGRFLPADQPLVRPGRFAPTVPAELR
ncbi:type VI protein secretion system component VasK [Variovorax boronicumulans]|uniref:Type VI protein secretion system component VasK n=1 Tax=Variovorax boronicumulans TaxID=436515 RepID=A0AAW8DSP3_9BURK|nr:type VI secretion system protein [Variovorax boronicumulans]MDP9876921.1 type VI protein secretion system component VasK [Variovorax boronicumulans]MDP9922202.1 type VI protein secretion system component VasK [Variovorax boronicumulans]